MNAPASKAQLLPETSPDTPRPDGAPSIAAGGSETRATFTAVQAKSARKFRKGYKLGRDGKPEKIPAAPYLNGVADRIEKTLKGLYEWLRGDPPGDAAFLMAGVNAKQRLVMGADGARRTADTFSFPDGPALLVTDSDGLDHWPALETPGNVVDALSVLGLQCDFITATSASSYLSWPSGSTGLRGLHTFAVIDRGSEIPRILEALHVRACLKGYGRILVTENGRMLVRSIVDLAMRVPSQPIYEWGAVCGPGVTQGRQVEFHGPKDGEYGKKGGSDAPILRAASIAPLTDEERADFEKWAAEQKAQHQAAAETRCEAWLDRRVATLPDAQRAAARRRLAADLEKDHRDLLPWFELTRDNGTTTTVEALLVEISTNPDKWHRKTLRDPYEPEYGPGHATIFCKEQKDGKVKILSMAHGIQVTYHLEPRCSAEDFEEFRVPEGANPVEMEIPLSEEFANQRKAKMKPVEVSNFNPLLQDLAMVRMGASAVVMILNGMADCEDGLNIVTVRAAKDLYANLDPKHDTFDAWLKHPNRVTYIGVEFAPSGGRPGYYNLWQGFAVKPLAGDCSLYLELVRQVICSGNSEHLEWLLNWMADVIQNPGRKPGTAVVLRGDEGSGKNVFIEQFGKLLGRAFKKVSRMEQLTGKFNKHLAGSLLIFANEAVWGGDRSREGALKDLITESKQRIEPKGIDSFEVDDYSRLIFATNEEWAVPAGRGARRFFVLDVSDLQTGNHAWFRALINQMENGGRAALMHHLQGRDLSQFNPRQAPKTDALLDLKSRNFKAHEHWWFEKLRDDCEESGESTPRGDLGEVFEQPLWNREVPKEVLYSEYHAFARRLNERFPLNKEHLGKALRKMVPGLDVSRPRIGGSRPYCYVIPSLAECRARWEEYVCQPVQW